MRSERFDQQVQRIRWAALDRLVPAQDWKCYLCGQSMRTRNEQSVDHVWPRVRNGYDGMGNMLAAHRACNTAKGERYPTGCELIMLHGINLKLRIETILVYPRTAQTLEGLEHAKS